MDVDSDNGVLTLENKLGAAGGDTSALSVASSEHKTNEKDAMLDRIANTDAYFKHQQRGDPDLTFEEKRTICSELLDKKPGLFLERYGKYLVENELSIFEQINDYTVQFYLKEVKKRIADSQKDVIVRNRRYHAMKQLRDSGDYFSDREMKSRDPLLYEQMVGNYLTEDEVISQVNEGDGAISTLLFDHIEAIHNNERYAEQVKLELSQLETSDSDEESEEESEMEDEDDLGRKQATPIPEPERLMLRHEFTTIMEQRFLHGHDEDFDYKEVDENVEHDCLDIRTQDEEEKYFDEEEPQAACSQASSMDEDIVECSTFKQMQIKDTSMDIKGVTNASKMDDSECDLTEST